MARDHSAAAEPARVLGGSFGTLRRRDRAGRIRTGAWQVESPCHA
jgi:hypothetical protein